MKNWKKERLHPLTYLCIWSILLGVFSLLWYAGMEETPKLEKITTLSKVGSSEDEPFQGSNVYHYIEFLQMPPETVFETIRVMITNKKNNSIFYDMEDFKEVSTRLEAEGYRGDLIYQQAVGQKEAFVVINELPLEEYLYAVVPSEMPASYPMEALKAQAICARTYAVLHMMNPAYPDYNAHVNDTTSFQVYHNIEEQEATNRAVDETAGMLLFQGNGEELAETYYYSTSCGESSEASTNVEFKAYISESYSSDFEKDESFYRWTYTVEKIDKEGMLKRIQERYDAGHQNVLTKTNGENYESYPVKELKQLRQLFISKRGEGGVAQELIITTAQNTYKILGEYNIRYVLNDAGISVKKQDGSQVKMNSLLPSAFISLEAVKNDGLVSGYQILGGGYGHGMGMSQNGAKGMANQGYTTEDILTYYYPGSKIQENF